MMVKVIELSIMNTSHINHTSRLIGKVSIGRFTPLNRRAMQVSQKATRKKVVFVGTTGMRHDEFDSHCVKFAERCWPVRFEKTTVKQPSSKANKLLLFSASFWQSRNFNKPYLFCPTYQSRNINGSQELQVTNRFLETQMQGKSQREPHTPHDTRRFELFACKRFRKLFAASRTWKTAGQARYEY